MDQFDPLFFNITPREAELMDPQERLFLECVYETLEDAGYTREALSQLQERGIRASVGVFVGVMYEEYQLYGAQEQTQGRPITLAGNPSSIANRVSYFFNFHGPSIALNTMCSSSLTALHLACQSLKQDDCNLAIAGGVNLSLHPNKYLALGQAKFASSKGRCESFGEGGDGYVPGEGVGAVLLKPLSKAIEDGDQIYGVIKGTALNHGGKTNGYTVPNPNAQAEVIERVLQNSGVNPRTISYIEAHGTGTALGDPIEITGLSHSFRKFTEDQQFCAIGSVKSNIGHCESAAGIAGLSKILLQLKHNQLVPSLHAKVVNSNLDLKQSPFYIQQELAEWKRPIVEVDGEAVEFPRIAGLSSFGAGGSNAHVVIEEYRPDERVQIDDTPNKPVMIILSAKNEEQLIEQARRLLDALSSERYTDTDLPRIAFTLQVGREAMGERLAIIANGLDDGIQKLRGFLAGQIDHLNIYRGVLKAKKDRIEDSESAEFIRKVNADTPSEQYERLLKLWVDGYHVNWRQLYADSLPQRISLPTYPFARERYWVPQWEEGMGMLDVISNTKEIHPLLHENTSNFSKQRYSSTFTGHEFFLRDHLVYGKRTMPGVACLEMVRVAVKEAVNEWLDDGAMTIHLSHVIWTNLLTIEEQPVKTHVDLVPGSKDTIAFEIYSDEVAPIIYCQGHALLKPTGGEAFVDIDKIKSLCSSEPITAEKCYAFFASKGIDYGPAQQGVKALYTGRNVILAQLVMPAKLSHSTDQYMLHPSIVDASLQAAIGFLIRDGEFHDDIQLKLPYALEEMELCNPCTTKMWAVLRYDQEKMDSGFVQKVDIDLCDHRGLVCIRMKGLTMRGSEGGIGRNEHSASKDTMLLYSSWKEKDVVKSETERSVDTQRIVVLIAPHEGEEESVTQRLDGVSCVTIQAAGKAGIEEQFQSCSVQLFEIIKRTLQNMPVGGVMLQTVVRANGNESSVWGALSALLRTAQLEHPGLISQLIEVDTETGTEKLIEIIEDNKDSPEHQVRYKHSNRYVIDWKEMESKSVCCPWKDKGVYLITGGQAE
nr:type I polyketide synthase [Bacillus paralicheniformis]